MFQKATCTQDLNVGGCLFWMPQKAFPTFVVLILLMKEILHQLIGSLSDDLSFFLIHPRWFYGFYVG